jgi:molybdate transport system permease protein
LEDVARLLGATRLQTFWHVSIPLARRGLASGLMLAFARALGEFGATVMVFGIQPRRTTLPISVYVDTAENGDLRHAAAAVVALSMISLGLMLAYNRSSLGVQER